MNTYAFSRCSIATIMLKRSPRFSVVVYVYIFYVLRPSRVSLIKVLVFYFVSNLS
jgi:hypothetical protein